MTQATTVMSQARRESGTRGLFSRPPMKPAFTPADARARLRELAPQVREALVLTPRGRVLAGPPELAAPAKAVLRAARAPALEASTEVGTVYAARSPRHAAIVVADRGTLPAPMLFGLRHTLAALEAASPT